MNLKKAKVLRKIAKTKALKYLKDFLSEEERDKLTFDMLPKATYRFKDKTIILIKPGWMHYYRYLKKWYSNVELNVLASIT